MVQAIPPRLAFGLLAAALISAGELTPRQQLGKALFHDRNLSLQTNQACVDCHAAEAGFAGAQPRFNGRGAVHEGSLSGRFGNRKPPSAAYASFSPPLQLTNEGTATAPEWLFTGGMFWDGRATGHTLGSPTAEQALGPFLNPLEQALPDTACVVYRACTAKYPASMNQVWGAGTCAIAWPSNIERACQNEDTRFALGFGDRLKVQVAYTSIGLAIADYEASGEVNGFSSKYDLVLQGKAQLTPLEAQGLELFRGTRAKCAQCHPVDRGEDGSLPLLTDFTYDNLGVPRNPDNPSGTAFVDEGLGGYLRTQPQWAHLVEDNLGKQKVPTLRNVDLRPNPFYAKSYTHNGYFKTLKGIVHFYNTRDVLPRCANRLATEAEALRDNCWPEAEYAKTVNVDELGNLQLTEDEELALVAFLRALSDGYRP